MCPFQARSLHKGFSDIHRGGLGHGALVARVGSELTCDTAQKVTVSGLAGDTPVEVAPGSLPSCPPPAPMFWEPGGLAFSPKSPRLPGRLTAATISAPEGLGHQSLEGHPL